jgi:plasmid stability protein
MASLLVRNVDEVTLAALKSAAARNGRSLQSEALRVLEEAARRERSTDESIRRADDIRERLRARGVDVADSTELIREDRAR